MLDDEVSQPTVPTPLADHIELRLEGPVHGWLSVVLKLGAYELAMSASMVLNDPIQELFDLPAFCRFGTTGFRRVCFWLEPQGYAIDVQSLNAALLMVTVRSDDSFVPPMAGTPMTVQHRCIVTRELFSAELAQALTQWLDNYAGSATWFRVEDRDRYRAALSAVSTPNQ